MSGPAYLPPGLCFLPYPRYPLRPKDRPEMHRAKEHRTSSLASTRSSSPGIRSLTPLVEPECKAQAWAISLAGSGQLLAGKAEETPREIASLTKIMTCHLSLHLLRYYSEVSLDTRVQVSATAAKLPGTTSDLRVGDRVSVRDLLYALMLPSGNDAAQCLAEFFGRYLALEVGGDPTVRLDRYFVREMNEEAGKLQLKHTFFHNAHGMSIGQNVSTAADINSLAAAALNSALFRCIVSTVQHTALIIDSLGQTRALTWDNTNKLLAQGFDGVKTGYTAHAGPCLCASVRSGSIRIIITVLRARDREERWREVPKLARWGLLAAAKLQ